MTNPAESTAPESGAFPSSPAETSPQSKSIAKQILLSLASLKFTVVLMGLAIFIVFAGTLVQVDKGIWSVIHDHFRSFFTWIELKIFFPRAWNVPGKFPFPGGWLIGALLLMNLLAAHAIRFKVTAKGKWFIVGILLLTVGIALTYLVISGQFTKELSATAGDEFWRVLIRLARGGVAAVILLAGCIFLFKKRAGIVLLHGGIILMLVGELITGTSAIESSMEIKEGGSSNFTYDIREVELSVIDPSHKDYFDVTAIPHSRLRNGASFSFPHIPFGIVIDRFIPNSTIQKVPEKNSTFQNQATAGDGKFVQALEANVVSGTSTENTVDLPSAYITIIDGTSQKPLHRYLVSTHFDDRAQIIAIDNKKFELHLRFKRTYKPYTIHLMDFKHDRYPGTNIPKNFSSQILLEDKEKGISRKVKIWMNNPLRYAGETFYQSGFKGENITILQVVQNAGWMIPYVACMIAMAGMGYHFWANLWVFLRRRASK